MPRPKPSRYDRLSLEERQLLKQQEELRRKEEELQSKLRSLPAKIQEKKNRDREQAKLRAVAAPEAISLGSAARGRNRTGRSTTKRRTRVGEFQSARIKFLVLCLILATFVVLLWRTIPS